MGCNCGGGKLKSNPTKIAERKTILQKRRTLLLKQQQQQQQKKKSIANNTSPVLKKQPAVKPKVI